MGKVGPGRLGLTQTEKARVPYPVVFNSPGLGRWDLGVHIRGLDGRPQSRYARTSRTC